MIGAVILIIGMFMTLWVARYTDQQLRASLSSRAETIAAGVHDDVLKRLTGASTDIGTDDYDDIKASMINTRKANPDARFVYLMGFRDDRLFFYADSEPPESKDYSAPGDLYADASDVKIKNAATGTVFTEGPYSDVWGSWVSGYAPVRDTDGTVLATIGIDIGSNAWKEGIVEAAALPAVITLSLLVFLALYYRYRIRQQEIDQMKSDFVSIASHQLRTPLTGIKWFSELLLAGKAGALTTDQHDFIQNIEESNDRMIALVDELLNVSRIEHGGDKFVIVKTPIDLVPFLRDVARDAEPGVVTPRIVLTLPEHAMSAVDQEKLRQVFQNLFSNALKYSPGDTQVTVVLHQEGGTIRITVADRGLGIPKKDQANLYNRFFRASNVQAAGITGNGLGLYVVKAIVEAHGGTLSFVSQENSGTTFTVVLPISST